MDAQRSTDSQGTEHVRSQTVNTRKARAPDGGINENYIEARHGPHYTAVAEAEHPQPASADRRNHAQSRHFRRKTRRRRRLRRRGIEMRTRRDGFLEMGLDGLNLRLDQLLKQTTALGSVLCTEMRRDIVSPKRFAFHEPRRESCKRNPSPGKKLPGLAPWYTNSDGPKPWLLVSNTLSRFDPTIRPSLPTTTPELVLVQTPSLHEGRPC